MTRTARAITLAVLMALGVVLAGNAAAKEKPRQLIAGEIPAWLRDARERPADPHAPWTLLHDEMIVEPLIEGGLRRTRRLAARASSVKLLDGFRSFNVVHGPDDTVLFAQGWTIHPDGAILMPDPKDDVSEVPWIDDGAVDYLRARHVELPEVIPGSIVAWEYQVREGLDKGATEFLFGDDSAPTRLSRVTLRVPADWSLEAHQVARGGTIFKETRSATEITLELSDVRPPPADPLPAPDSEMLPSAWLRWFSPDGSRGFRDWAAVGRWMSALAKEPASQLGGIEALSREFAPPSSPAPASGPELRAAIERAFHFASRSVRYVAIEIGIGGYKPASPEATCRDRFGDCKAKSFLLRALVQPWGLKAWPVLVSTRDQGAVNPDVPTPGQFNHLILAIELPPSLSAPDQADVAGWAIVDVPGIGRLAFLDPTVSSAASAPLRADDQGTLALLVHDSGAQLVQLPEQPPELAGKSVELDATIDATGLITQGRVVSTWKGTSAASMRDDFLSVAQANRLTWAVSRAQNIAPGVALSEHAITGLDDVTLPITEAASLTGGRLARRAMDLLIVLPGAVAPPIVSDRPAPPPRAWPLNLGVPRSLEAIVRIHPPEGWGPEKLPAPWEITTAHLSGRITWEAADDGTLTWRRLVRVLSTRVAPGDYAEFHRALTSTLSRDAEGLTLIARAP